MWRRSAIVLVFFSRGGLIISKLRRVEIVGLGKELRWLCKILKKDFSDLVHLLEFMDVSLEFRNSVRARGRIFREST